MKTASAWIHIAALGACFVVNFSATSDFRMPGVRKALETMTITQKQSSGGERPELVVETD
jgi:hypothetical protein